MRFLIDTNLPKSLAPWFESKGHTADHVLALDLGRATDAAIWRRAADTSAIIVSKDEDFAALARVGPQGPNVVWIRTGNGTTRALLQFLDPMWPAIETALMRGDRLVEVR